MQTSCSNNTPAGHRFFINAFDVKNAVFVMTVILVIAVCGLPLFNLARLGLARFDTTAFDTNLLKALYNTLTLATMTTISALIIGTVCAFFLSRTDLFYKNTLKTFLLYPYIIPPFITGIGWIILANPGAGLITAYFPEINIYTMTGLVLVETSYWYTYVLLNVANVLENLDGSLEESARMCGASPARIFFTITLPLIRPALIGSGIIVFLCTASSFGVPAIIGGPGKISVITTKIYQLIKIGTPNAIFEAMTVSLPFILSAFVLIYCAEKFLNRKSYSTLSGKHNRKLTLKLRRWRAPITAGFTLFSLISIGLPFATILITSLMKVYGDWHLSLVNYRAVLLHADTIISLKNSFLLALCGSVLLSVLGFLIAYYKEKTRFRGTGLLTAFATLPYATPGTILAMAILFSLAGIPPFPLLLLAYVAKYLSQGIKVLSPALINVDKSLEESALMCGASWLKTITTIWLPLLRGTLSTCVFLMIAPLFSELTMSIMLASSDFPTVGTRLFHLQEYESPNHAAVLAVLILVLIMGLNLVVKKLSKGKLGV